MKVKIFRKKEVRERIDSFENRINDFMEDKEVIDVKPFLTDGTSIYVTVLYK